MKYRVTVHGHYANGAPGNYSVVDEQDHASTAIAFRESVDVVEKAAEFLTDITTITITKEE